MSDEIEKYENEVSILSGLAEFEETYLSVREKEGRIYADSVLKELPNIAKTHEQFAEWSMRQKSCNRFISYLGNNVGSLQILDLGAGNGWFSNKMASVSDQFQVTAVDMNLLELQQGARVLKKDNLKFCYANIFDDVFEKNNYDLIIINSVIQYFESVPKLLNRLTQLLKENGSIHILDSPIYKQAAIAGAKKRSEDYFKKMGVPAMAANYHHHSWSDFDAFKIQINYDPKSIQNKIKKLAGIRDIPFPWIEIKK